MAIDEYGKAYSFGQSSNGQLGLTTKTLESFEPSRIKVSTSSVPKGTLGYRYGGGKFAVSNYVDSSFSRHIHAVS